MRNAESPGKTRIVLWALFVLSTIFALSDSPQGLMFPLLIASYLFKEKLAYTLRRLPLSIAFIGTGLAFGLLIEVCAIIENINLPPHDRVLLHPTPAVDLLIACFWYGGFILTWYLLLRKVHFSKKTVYLSSALYGVFTEFGVFTSILANPLIGILLATIVTAAYGIFPFIAYMLTEERFGSRATPLLRHYIYIVLAFLGFWVVMGNFVYNPLIEIFPKGF